MPDGNVVVSWPVPDDRSSPILKYIIEFYKPLDSTWFEDLIHCDGTKSTVLDTASCSLPMSRFTDAAVGYNLFDTIKVKISAQNEKGYTDSASPVSTGTATAKLSPVDMPSNSLTRGE